MKQADKLELISAIGQLLPLVQHTLWPSGKCDNDCKGCRVEQAIRLLLFLTENIIASDGAMTPEVLNAAIAKNLGWRENPIAQDNHRWIRPDDVQADLPDFLDWLQDDFDFSVPK